MANSNSVAVVKHRRMQKQKLIEAFGGKCCCCGYNRCVRALEFHHKDPTQKDFHFGRKFSISWSKLVKEIQKCVMVCANCHREIHDGILLIPDFVKGLDVSLIITESDSRKKKGASQDSTGVDGEDQNMPRTRTS